MSSFQKGSVVAVNCNSVRVVVTFHTTLNLPLRLKVPDTYFGRFTPHDSSCLQRSRSCSVGIKYNISTKKKDGNNTRIYV